MKKTLLLLSLLSVSLAGLPRVSEAKKKYRYIKRAHGVRLLNGGFDMTIGGGSTSSAANFGGAYTFNWKGMVEVGPYFHLAPVIQPEFNLGEYQVGLLLEYNFIKNRGKKKAVPALGLKLGIKGAAAGGINLAAGPHVAGKFFAAKRTALLVSLGYLAVIPTDFDFQSMLHDVDFSFGFAHYFDF